MISERSKRYIVYGLYGAQRSGWQGKKILRLATDCIPNSDDSPPGWRAKMVELRAEIDDVVQFRCNKGDNSVSICRPMQITQLQPETDPPKVFRGPNGETPDGGMDYEVRGIPHAVGLHEMPQAQADGTMFYRNEPQQLLGTTVEQDFFEKILGLGDESICWYAWDAFVRFIDPDPGPPSIDWHRWYAWRGFERRLAREGVRDEKNAPGKDAMLAWINQWQATQEKPKDDFLPDL